MKQKVAKPMAACVRPPLPTFLLFCNLNGYLNCDEWQRNKCQLVPGMHIPNGTAIIWFELVLMKTQMQ